MSRDLIMAPPPPPPPPPSGIEIVEAAPYVDDGVGAFLAGLGESSDEWSFAALTDGGGAGDAVGAALSAADLIGCCSGRFARGALHIGVLVVREEWRRRGVGAALLARAEALALEQNCRDIAVETFDFQAPRFYSSRGYVLDFAQRGWQAGAELLYFSKRLSSI